ncbi:hypothetical protein ABZ894_17840, partial [Nocardia beijingensis]|uniref:hypothetical protein n=1 Tax=Nocardia beijingensis TaxID=95162 RepID=UPI0033FAE2AD
LLDTTFHGDETLLIQTIAGIGTWLGWTSSLLMPSEAVRAPDQPLPPRSIPPQRKLRGIPSSASNGANGRRHSTT